MQRQGIPHRCYALEPMANSVANCNNLIANPAIKCSHCRIVGGLLGAHLLARRAGADLEKGWPCEGPLLRLAEDVATRQDNHDTAKLHKYFGMKTHSDALSDPSRWKSAPVALGCIFLT